MVFFYDKIYLGDLMLKEKLFQVPDKPGCYLMKNKNNTIIYVGKAKNLKKRLKGYFNGRVEGKTEKLVSNINDFDYIITNNEIESLLLENNLIKKHNPKYNILLKDDKTYPYIELTKEKYPRLRIIRNKKNKDYGYLFGPYTNATIARKITDLLNRTFMIRKCNNLPKKECLYYHIGQCKGYCIYQEEQVDIQGILDFFKGEYKEVINIINEKIKKLSNDLEYEKALEYKQLLDFINEDNKQKIDIKSEDDFDIFGYYASKGYLSIEVLFVRNGKITANSSNVIDLVDTLEEDLLEYILTFYNRNNLIMPPAIYVPQIIEEQLLSEALQIKVIKPQKGNRKKILDMANINAEEHLKVQLNTLINKEEKTFVANQELGKLLNIKDFKKVELFDNSVLFGTFSVSGMVVFVDGEPQKKEYRKFKVQAEDDYNMMKEVIYRRYFRVLKDKLERPDIIIVDGGIGQVNVAKMVLEELNMGIPVYGLKKDDKHNTNELVSDKNIVIPKRSNIFLLLERMQDEVHNYTINYHKQLRSKGALTSAIEMIPGIGKKRMKLLIKRYGSLKKMKEATDLEKIIPEKVAQEVYKYLKTIE